MNSYVVKFQVAVNNEITSEEISDIHHQPQCDP